MTLDQASKAMLIRVGLVCLVAGAGWHFGVSKYAANLGETKSKHAARQAEIDQGQADQALSVMPASESISNLRGQADLLRDFWAVSGDAGMLNDAVSQQAHKAGVTILRLEPRRMAPGRVPNGLAGTEEWAINVMGYSIDVSGEYAAVGRFVQAIQNDTGMSRVDSIRVMETESKYAGKNHIRASISTMHYGLRGALESFGPRAKAGDG